MEDNESSQKMFKEGFFLPGDVAVARPDGRVRILGRTADVLNILGHKVAVAPLELEIQRALGVDEVCLFSGLTDAGKEELVVVVQSDRMPPKADLDLIEREFPAFARVRFEFFRELPRTSAGTRKVRRSELRKLVFPGLGGQAQ